MRFGISIVQTFDGVRDVGDTTRLVEENGFDLVGIPDSQAILREMWICATVAAQNSRECLVGPMVTNPVTRHPSITASAIRSLDELAPGRVFLGIGAGESATSNARLASASIVSFEAALRDLKALFDEAAVKVPLFVAARGPKTISMAARFADALVIDVGLEASVLGRAIEAARTARESSDRAGEPLEIWILGKGFVSDDPEEASDAVGAIMAASAAGLRGDLDWKGTPPEMRSRLHRFRAGYQYGKHADVRASRSPNAELLDELGLTDFMLKRFALVGNAGEVISRLKELSSLGVDGVSFTGSVKGRGLFIERFRREVIPHFRGKST